MVLGFMVGVWLVSVVRRNASLVDRVWATLFVLLAWTYVAVGEETTARSYLAATLVTVWGLRLSIYLTRREWGHGEDWRYQAMRERAGRSFALRSLVTVFLFQGLAAIGVSTPLLAVVEEGQPSLRWLDACGVAVWAVGFLFEAVGDLQLARFRADPSRRGGVLDDGLWRYTRHPNYFGDAVQWWGLGLIGLSAGAWWSLLGPAGMTVVLLRVTGVSVMDPHLARTRGAAHQEYVRRTSAFVPRPPLSRRQSG